MLSSVFYTFFTRLLLWGVIGIFFIPATLLIFIVPQKYRYNRAFFLMSYLLYKAIIRISLLSITIVGKQHIPKGPAIYVANHSSSLDIPMLGSLIGCKPHVWFAMKWLTRFWFFRLILPRVAVLVDMEDPQSNVRSLLKMIQMAKQNGMSIMIFPEGKRYIDDQIHDFYGGFGLLAKKTEFPVVPVRLFNLEKVYPPDTFWVHYHPVRIVIGEPMYIQHDETDDAFKERVHQWFVNVGTENEKKTVRPE